MSTRVSFKNSRNLTLIGSLWPASSDALIIMAHGSGSNRLAKGLFEPIAVALQAENYNVLSFDFAGHGESDDDITTVKKSVDDFAAVLDFVKKEGYNRIAFFGHSLGAYVCLASYFPEVETMVFVGPLTGAVNWKWEDFCSPEEVKALYKQGYLAHAVNDRLRKVINFDANLFNEIQQINQALLLAPVKCPVLMIHGDGDQQELDLLAVSKKALPLLPQGSELQMLPGTTHSFLEHKDEVVALARHWYKRYFPL